MVGLTAHMLVSRHVLAFLIYMFQHNALYCKIVLTLRSFSFQHKLERSLVPRRMPFWNRWLAKPFTTSLFKGLFLPPPCLQHAESNRWAQIVLRAIGKTQQRWRSWARHLSFLKYMLDELSSSFVRKELSVIWFHFFFLHLPGALFGNDVYRNIASSDFVYPA